MLCAVALSVTINEFGLYGDVQGKEYRIWAYERATKYLFSTNYIPANFDSVMLGPSVSDVMLDTRKITSARMYNLSLNGGNICELKKLYDNVAERKHLKSIVLFVSPFILKDCAMKTTEINPQVKQSALGSIFSLRFYLMKLKAMRSPAEDPFRESWWGFRLNNTTPPGYDHKQAIEKLVDKGFDLDMDIDPQAAQALKDIMKTAVSQGSRIVVVYPPMPHPLYVQIEKKYAHFRNQTEKLLPPNCTIIDFNAEKYLSLNSDLGNYHDPSHLNEQGAAMVLKVLDRNLQ